MGDTRAALSEKLETLEEKVRGKIDQTQERLRATLNRVKETFDLEHQVRQRPWLMLGAATASGFVAGNLLARPRRGRIGRALASSLSSASGQAAAKGSELVDRLGNRFAQELDHISSVLIGAGAEKIRSWLESAMSTPTRSDAAGTATRRAGRSSIRTMNEYENTRHL